MTGERHGDHESSSGAGAWGGTAHGSPLGQVADQRATRPVGYSALVSSRRGTSGSAITGHTAATTEHGEAFAAIVQRGQVEGVQFHPEKSGDVGLRILRNFRQMVG